MQENFIPPASEILTYFFDDLLHQGRATIASGIAYDTPVARELLRSAYSVYRLSIAGPEILFNPDVAVNAGLIVRAACVALLDRGERPESLILQFHMPFKPSIPEHHLSADFLFRFLPQIIRRARGLDPDDPMILMLKTLLREWPLSGILAEIDESPTSRLDFCGHPGLCLLYSERLAHHDRPSWYPEGAAGAYQELVRDSSTRN